MKTQLEPRLRDRNCKVSWRVCVGQVMGNDVEKISQDLIVKEAPGQQGRLNLMLTILE